MEADRFVNAIFLEQLKTFSVERTKYHQNAKKSSVFALKRIYHGYMEHRWRQRQIQYKKIFDAFLMSKLCSLIETYYAFK
jgi:hypothetical protein